jgi:alpha-amylase
MLRSALAVAAAVFAVVGCSVPAEVETATEDFDSEQSARESSEKVFVHLFEWKWTDIAKECETYLGPKGYAGVQISPPNEHIVVPAKNYPWWQRYQPVSYRLESRSGTRAEFVNMVQRCRAKGVGIYVDAVINHMTGIEDGKTGVGIAGSRYSHYDYPGLYSRDDFNHCGLTQYNDITDYNDRAQVQTCELLNLADLKTSSPSVQGKIRTYLQGLLDLGVAGFRIDAAKHMPASEIGAILRGLRGYRGEAPFIFQEVIDRASGEPIRAREYLGNASVTEFRYGMALASAFAPNGRLETLRNLGGGFLPPASAVVFTDNHDIQRGHGGADGTVLTHKQPEIYRLANVFMLAWPYGRPSVMSSYTFRDGDQGPPSDARGQTKSVFQGEESTCFKGEWICEHRWAAIGNMVAFRKQTAGQAVQNFATQGKVVSFNRGNKGFVAINAGGAPYSQTFQTGLPAGTYCDVIKGEVNAARNGCVGNAAIVVGANGTATVSIPARTAVALHAGARVGS